MVEVWWGAEWGLWLKGTNGCASVACGHSKQHSRVAVEKQGMQGVEGGGDPNTGIGNLTHGAWVRPAALLSNLIHVKNLHTVHRGAANAHNHITTGNKNSYPPCLTKTGSQGTLPHPHLGQQGARIIRAASPCELHVPLLVGRADGLPAPAAPSLSCGAGRQYKRVRHEQCKYSLL